jgi:YVTN family beta-propeller protein
MKISTLALLAGVCFVGTTAAWAGQAPGAASDPDIPTSHRDRVYSAEQFSNTVSVTDPVDNRLVGVVRLGDPQPGNFSPLYRGQVLVHGENADGITAIDTATNKVIATSPIGQAPQAITYVPNAVPAGEGKAGLQQLDLAGRATHLVLGAADERKPAQEDSAPTSISLFDQGLIQVLQASVTGLEPKQPYILGLSYEPSGEGSLEPLAAFMTNPAGAAIVNATGPIRQVVHGEDKIQRRYLVIAEGVPDRPGRVVQVQLK